jgi:hypothetical protein
LELRWCYFSGGVSGAALEKQIPFGSAQGRLSRQKKGARNDKNLKKVFGMTKI